MGRVFVALCMFTVFYKSLYKNVHAYNASCHVLANKRGLYNIPVTHTRISCLKLHFVLHIISLLNIIYTEFDNKQESPAIADKPARRESLPTIAPIRRVYNVVADSTGLSSFVYLLLRPKSAKSREIHKKSNLWSSRHPRSSILVSMESPYVTSY